ncbi:DNA ligase D [Proteiniclasticum sp. C24MP]|uniref:DNA ligase D n=1 Tax=Proteiniclasticum sp. C24MP TaxID=3374101 RepID=UPI00375406D7
MADKLETYNKKRDFRKTKEPSGKEEKSSGKLRFVVQKHDASRLHYDFRIEWEGVLLSWAVPKGPSYNPKDKRLAVEVEPHPMSYRDFEGTIPEKEYGGGTVMLFDEGYWEPQEEMEKNLEEGSIKMILQGERLKGRWALVRMKSKKEEGNRNWLLIKEKDELVQDEDGIGGFTTSVRTGRTMEEIAQDKKPPDSNENKKLPFHEYTVQLAKLEEEVPEDEDWVYELKYDGYRITAEIEAGEVRLLSRNRKDYTKKFPVVVDALKKMADTRNMILDGEIVVLDKRGRSDFQKLQRYLKNPGGKNITYILFDLLALDEEDHREYELMKRKEELKKLVGEGYPHLHYSEHTNGDGRKILKAACDAQMEGIIGKKARSRYAGTRNGDWIKVKCDRRQEFVIGGYTSSDNRSKGVSSLLLGVYEKGELIYAGRTGTGFSLKERKELEKKFSSITRKTAPFKEAPEERKGEEVFWLTPKLIAEVKFQEWTDENLLRQASYKGLREDKNPEKVIRESVGTDDLVDELNEIVPEDKVSEREAKKTGKAKKTRSSFTIRGIRISSPDKDMYPGEQITKEDVAEYYQLVSERMMPFTAERVLSFLRCPDGIKECFYQKHLEQTGKGLEKIRIEEKDGDKEDYVYISSVQGLLSSVQMGTLEFHIWGSKVDQLEYPDMIVFDLDPAEGMEMERVREGVRDMKEILDELSLTSFLKTSGGKGYHIVVPVNGSADWDAVRSFAKLCAQAMEERWPEKYTSNMRKEKRKGKIFIDWVRNGRSATSVAPYSLRARKGAPISMPIFWEELDELAPAQVTLHNVKERLEKEDPWKDFFKVNQGIRGKLDD